MRMTTKHCNWNVWAMLTDGIIEKSKATCGGGPSRWIMANHYKEIDGFLKVDSIEEPLLFHEIGSFNDLRGI